MKKIKFKKWVIMITISMIFCVILLFVSFKSALIVSKNKDRIVNKYQSYYKLLLAWLTSMENGQSICNYLKEKGYINIAIYGGRDIGEHLINQLANTGISVDYIIDRSINQANICQIPVYSMNDKLITVDAIIVTPIWDYENIKEQLLGKVDCPIISIKDILVREINE